ncbi:hypothetical protein CRUP_036967 [Coryphaenoides rupestris]|nr:hypothetical protein CRUP_036967 [Coryphaenoides rupestris]
MPPPALPPGPSPLPHLTCPRLSCSSSSRPVPHKHPPCSQLQEGPGPKVSICTWCDHYDAVGYGALASVCGDDNTGGVVASYASPSTYKAPNAAGCVGPAAPLLNLHLIPAAYQFPSCVATSQPVSAHSCFRLQHRGSPPLLQPGLFHATKPTSLPLLLLLLHYLWLHVCPLWPLFPIPMHVSSGCCCPCGRNCGRTAAETQRTVLHGAPEGGGPENTPPVGVFWDIENCCVPSGRSAATVVQRLRSRFFQGHREAEFICVCDISKECKAVIQDLNNCQVPSVPCLARFRLNQGHPGSACCNLNMICPCQVTVAHINATAKNAADDKLRQSLRRFAETHAAPATVVLVSSDVNFASELSDLRHRHGFQVILVHGAHTSPALLQHAHRHVAFQEITADLPPSFNLLYVHNLPVICDKSLRNAVKLRLRRLSDNCGGKVVGVSQGTAVLRFGSADAAERACKRMENEDVFGYRIRPSFSPRPGGGNDRQGPVPLGPVPQDPVPQDPVPQPAPCLAAPSTCYLPPGAPPMPPPPLPVHTFSFLPVEQPRSPRRLRQAARPWQTAGPLAERPYSPRRGCSGPPGGPSAKPLQLKLWFFARIHLVQELGDVEANPKMVFQLLENVCSSSTTITCNTNSPPRCSVDSALERLPKPGLIGESMYRRRADSSSPLRAVQSPMERGGRSSPEFLVSTPSAFSKLNLHHRSFSPLVASQASWSSRSASPCLSSRSSPLLPGPRSPGPDSPMEVLRDGPEVQVANLDYRMSRKELQQMLPHTDYQLKATVQMVSVQQAISAVSRLHRYKIGGKRTARCALAIQGCQVIGQLDSPVVEVVQLLHDEFEVRGQARLTGEAPDDRRDGHDGGQQQQSTMEEPGKKQSICGPTPFPWIGHKMESRPPVLELKDVPPPPHHISTASHQLFHLAPPPLPPPDLPTPQLQLQLPPVPHKHPPCSQLQEGPGPKVSICTWCDHYDAVGYGALASVCGDDNTGGVVASYASPSTYKAPNAAGCVGPAAPLLNLHLSGTTSEASNVLCSPAAYQFPSCVATSQPVSAHSCSACSTGVLHPYSSLSLPCHQANLPPPPPSSSPLPLAPRLSSLATLPIPMHVSSGCCCPCGTNCGRTAAETQRTVLHGAPEGGGPENTPPVGVFWDIENCCVPSGRSAATVVQRLRSRFFQGHREAEFICVCDISKECKAVIQDLNNCQVPSVPCLARFRLNQGHPGSACCNLNMICPCQVTVAHINATAKNAADDKLRQSLRRFAETHAAPATVVLVSSDVNFASELSDLRHRHGFQVILVHGAHTSPALLQHAHRHVAFQEITADLPACR